MNKDQLGYFSALYQTHSVSAAALQVPMSVQGLNKSIHALESELGVTLFEAGENGSRIPTSYADAFARHVEEVGESYDHLIEIFAAIKAAEKKIIRLGCCLGVMGYVASPCIEAFMKRHPDIAVESGELDDTACDAAIKHGMCEMGLTLAPFDEGLVTVPLLQERTYFWVNRKNPLSEKAFLSLSDLRGQNISIFGNGIKVHDVLMASLQRADVRTGSIRISSEAFWHYQAALQGEALGFSVEHLVDIDLFSRNSEVVAIPFSDMMWTVALSYSPIHALSPYEQEFFDFVIEYAQRNYPAEGESAALTESDEVRRTRAAFPQLSGRECDVVACMAQGRSLKSTCDLLCISYNTGKTHMRHVYQKLNVSNRDDLMDLLEM